MQLATSTTPAQALPGRKGRSDDRATARLCLEGHPVDGVYLGTLESGNTSIDHELIEDGLLDIIARIGIDRVTDITKLTVR